MLWPGRASGMSIPPLDLSAGLLPGRSTKDDETWVDPVIGLRAILDLGDGFSVLAFADIGGFGVGSDQTWEALRRSITRSEIGSRSGPAIATWRSTTTIRVSSSTWR